MRSADEPTYQSPLIHSPSDLQVRRAEPSGPELEQPAGVSDLRTQHRYRQEPPGATDSTRMQISGEVTARGQVAITARQERHVKKNLNFQYEYFEYFVYSQCLPAWLLLLLRLAMGCVCVTVFLFMTIWSPFVNFVTNSTNTDAGNDTTQAPATFKRHFYLCYLTIWSYMVIMVYFITTLVNTISLWVSTCQSSDVNSDDFSLKASGFKSTDNLLDNRSGSGDLTSGPGSSHGSMRQFGLRLQWLLCGVAANAALLVTCGYFMVLYPMIKKISPGGISAVDLLVHGFNTIFMFLEVTCSGVPIRLVHAVYTALYGLAYGLFSLLYWIPDHTNVIYPVLLDWNNAGLTIAMMCIILFVGLPLFQLFWWLVYLARCFVAAALLGRGGIRRSGLGV